MKKTLTAILLVWLGGCADPTKAIKNILENSEQSLTPPKLEPVKTPTIEPVSDFIGENFKDPFFLPKPAVVVRQPTDPLEAFPLESLKMVGTLGVDRKKVALIAAPDGKIYLVGPGRYMGKQGSRVISVGDQALVYETTIDNGSGNVQVKTGKIMLEKGDHVQTQARAK